MKAKNINKIWFLFIPLYFATRLVNLKILPIFTDEAIYAYWSQIALHDPANRFISMEDGKQPLFIWFAAAMQKIISDPLIALRLVSVLAGLGSLVGIYFLAKELTGKKTAILSAFLYIILPFTLLYDRMGLYDSTLTMFCIWAVYFSTLQVRKLRLDIAFALGFALGLGMITKSSAELFLILIPLSLLTLNFRDKNLKVKLFKWFGFTALSALIAEVIYNSLRVSPLFYIINQKNREFIRPLSEVIKDPFLHALSNATALLGWLNGYIWYGLTFAFLLGVSIAFFKRDLKAIYLFLLALVIFTIEVFFNQILYVRFLLFYFPFILILTAYGLVKFRENNSKFKNAAVIFLVISLIYPVYNSYLLITKPAYADIPKNDADQYLNSWPAGYGVEEVKSFIKSESLNKKVFVGTEGTFGLFPFSLNVYFYKDPNVQIMGYWPVNPNSLPQAFVDSAKNRTAYFIFNQGQEEVNNPHLVLIAKYQKGRGDSFMRLYKYLK